MSAYEDRLALLEKELEALRRVKTQEDYDEGERLHREHNAPWVKGMYTHLKFPPYVFQAYPKMLYSTAYEDACRECDAAVMLPARGSDDSDRATAILLAERKKNEAVCIVQNPSEEAVRQGTWFDSPAAAVAAKAKWEAEIALAAAHRNYEDRNMGDGAKREIEHADNASDGHLAEIPEQTKRGRPRKLAAVE